MHLLWAHLPIQVFLSGSVLAIAHSPIFLKINSLLPGMVLLRGTVAPRNFTEPLLVPKFLYTVSIFTISITLFLVFFSLCRLLALWQH